MRAIIMAGGAGKRLRPLTCTMPKPMVPMLGKPIIDYCVELCVRHGIRDITATLQYLPEAIKKHLGDGSAFDAVIRYSVEERPLGTAGSVRLALGEDHEPCLVISGDALTDMDLSAAIAAHWEKGAAATIILSRVQVPTEYGVVLLNEDGRITRFLEKPQLSEVFSDLANTGVYILGAEALAMIPTDRPYDFSADLFPRMLARDMPLYGFVSESYWCDVGGLAQYVQAQNDLLAGKCAYAATCPALEPGVYVEPGARISKKAVLVQPCFIGAGAEIAENAIIGPGAVIGRGSRVGSGSSVKRGILMEGVRLRENVEIRGAVLCERAEMQRDSMAFDGAAVGAASVVEAGACIKPGVSVWPERRVEAGSTCTENLIWQRGRSTEPASGYYDSDLGPTRATRVGAAFASLLRLPARVAIATDGSLQAGMLRHALIAGVLSQGVDVYDMGHSSRSAAAYGVVNLGLDGGLYITHDPKDPHHGSILLWDAMGLPLASNEKRRFEQVLSDGDLHPVTAERLGVIAGAGDGYRAYEASLTRSGSLKKGLYAPCTLVVAADAEVYDSVARVLLPLGFRLLYCENGESDRLMASMAYADAALGFAVDRENGISVMIYGQKEIGSAERTMLVLLDALEEGYGAEFDLPVNVPEEYAAYLRGRGAVIKRVSAAPEKWRREMRMDGRDHPAFTEPEAAIVKFAELSARDKLQAYLDMLPELHIENGAVGCSWREMGRVFRSLVETEKSERLTLLDGVCVQDTEGWVLVRPEKLRECRVVASSMNAEYAKELCDLYMDKIRHILEAEKEP